MTYEEIEVITHGSSIRAEELTLLLLQQAYPEDFANRDEYKFNYRYRGRSPT